MSKRKYKSGRSLRPRELFDKIFAGETVYDTWSGRATNAEFLTNWFIGTLRKSALKGRFSEAIRIEE